MAITPVVSIIEGRNSRLYQTLSVLRPGHVWIRGLPIGFREYSWEATTRVFGIVAPSLLSADMYPFIDC